MGDGPVASFLGGDPVVFWIVTVLLFGFAAFLSGQAVARIWRPVWQILPIALLLAAGSRFMLFALFEARLLAPGVFLIAFFTLAAIAAIAFFATRAGMMVRQYPGSIDEMAHSAGASVIRAEMPNACWARMVNACHMVEGRSGVLYQARRFSEPKPPVFPDGTAAGGLMDRFVRPVILAAALALGSAGLAKAQDIHVAVVGPLTGSEAAFGEQMKHGAEMAVTDINAKGGVLGRKLVLEIADDACDPKQAVAAANQVAGKKVAFVAGHYCSSSSIPASAVYNESGIIQMTPGSTNPALTDDAFKKKWSNVFRVCGRDDSQGAVAGKYLAEHYKGKPIAIVHDKTAYGQGLADETRKALIAAGGKDAVYEAITKGEKDFSALISKLKQANVEAIYFGGYQTEAGLIVRQARDQGLKAILISGDAMMSEDFWKITGSAGEGSMMTFPPDPRNVPTAKAVVEKFKTQGYNPEGYTLYTYAAFQAFAAAAEKSKSIKDDDLAKALRSMTVDTVIGPIAWNEKGDVTDPKYVFYVWKNGSYSEM